MKIYTQGTWLFAVAVSLSACSNWFEHEQRQGQQAVVKQRESGNEVTQVPVMEAKEPGSIWSNASYWNDFYSPAVQREVGDLIILRPSDTFRLTVSNQSGTGPGWEALQGGRDSSQVLSTIREVLPHNVYRIEAKQSLKVGIRDHEIKLEGKIREKDLAADDSSSTDSLFDVSLRVGNTAGIAQPVAASEKTAERKVASLPRSGQNPQPPGESASSQVGEGGTK